VQCFTACMPLLTSAFGLGRRRWSSHQQCYLYIVRTPATPLGGCAYALNKGRVLPSPAMSQTPDLENFATAYRSSKRVISMPNFIKISQTVVDIWRFNGFQNGGRPPSWICLVHIWTTHDEHLMFFRLQ